MLFDVLYQDFLDFYTALRISHLEEKEFVLGKKQKLELSLSDFTKYKHLEGSFKQVSTGLFDEVN